ncbi:MULTISPECIES: hypothetical protein [Mesorhizobium]|uniref:hypothetical protein n=1 Tax=unclassified Mesorhizobium TaxID=325217 RepID=UPI0007A93A0E|nr:MULTISPECIES: hypothetical protein [Mesorhizobium]AMX93633.1 hypothetical protein A4R28_11250 [Mesorhizobium ciceri]MDF3208324.1 hypothetical protein [Mesorhizobium sp. LMG15046]MDF3229104.1 hypothetical protein [Mesorhizobium sp. DSM 30133]
MSEPAAQFRHFVAKATDLGFLDRGLYVVADPTKRLQIWIVCLPAFVDWNGMVDVPLGVATIEVETSVAMRAFPVGLGKNQKPCDRLIYAPRSKIYLWIIKPFESAVRPVVSANVLGAKIVMELADWPP